MNGILKNSTKLFMMLLFVAFAGFILAMSFTVMFSKSPEWVFNLFFHLCAWVLLVAVIWSAIYDLGFKDGNMVRTGNMKKDLFKGFKIGAIAQIPAALFLIISLVFNFIFSWYLLPNFVYYGFLKAIAGDVSCRIRDIGATGIVLMFLLLLIVPVISGAIYVLGYNGIDLFSKLVYKKRGE